MVSTIDSKRGRNWNLFYQLSLNACHIKRKKNKLFKEITKNINQLSVSLTVLSCTVINN